jgi:hypothetical protein
LGRQRRVVRVAFLRRSHRPLSKLTPVNDEDGLLTSMNKGSVLLVAARRYPVRRSETGHPEFNFPDTSSKKEACQ